MVTGSSCGFHIPVSVQSFAVGIRSVYDGGAEPAARCRSGRARIGF